MPKVVDHDGRREEVADALLRLVEREGVEGVSMRAVAAEAGASTGVLAHYFRDKDAMLTFAFERVAERAGARAARRLSAAADPRASVRALLAEALPADAARRREARLWFAYLERARTAPAMAEVVRRRYADWTGALARALRAAGTPEARAGGDALVLIALVDGITVRALADARRLPRAAQHAALEAVLDLFLPAGGP